MSYTQKVVEDRRLVILRLLDEVGGSANDAVLAEALRHWGHSVGRDLVKADLAWLADQGLVGVDRVGAADPYHVATITDRGAEVAAGLAHVPGVKRARPRPAR